MPDKCCATEWHPQPYPTIHNVLVIWYILLIKYRTRSRLPRLLFPLRPLFFLIIIFGSHCISLCLIYNIGIIVMPISWEYIHICVCVCIHVYIHPYVYTYTYIYIASVIYSEEFVTLIGFSVNSRYNYEVTATWWCVNEHPCLQLLPCIPDPYPTCRTDISGNFLPEPMQNQLLTTLPFMLSLCFSLSANISSFSQAR